MVDQVSGSPFGAQQGGRKMTVKAMKRMLKKAGLKTTGKRAALTRRVKKAHLKGGDPKPLDGGRRRRRRGGADATCTDPDGNAVMPVPDDGWTSDNCTSPNTFTAATEGGRRRRGSRRGVFGRLF